MRKNNKKFKLIFILWSGVKEEKIPKIISKIESNVFKDKYFFIDKEVFHHSPVLEMKEKDVVGFEHSFEYWLLKYYLCCDPEKPKGYESYDKIEKCMLIDKKPSSQLVYPASRELQVYRNKYKKMRKTGYDFYSIIYHGEKRCNGFKNLRASHVDREIEKERKKFHGRIVDVKSQVRNAVARSGESAHAAIHCFIFESDSDTAFEDSQHRIFFDKNLEFFKQTCKTTKVDI